MTSITNQNIASTNPTTKIMVGGNSIHSVSSGGGNLEPYIIPGITPGFPVIHQVYTQAPPSFERLADLRVRIAEVIERELQTESDPSSPSTRCSTPKPPSPSTVLTDAGSIKSEAVVFDPPPPTIIDIHMTAFEFAKMLKLKNRE
jgi:hypothetical protein